MDVERNTGTLKNDQMQGTEPGTRQRDRAPGTPGGERGGIPVRSRFHPSGLRSVRIDSDPMIYWAFLPNSHFYSGPRPAPQRDVTSHDGRDVMRPARDAAVSRAFVVVGIYI